MEKEQFDGVPEPNPATHEDVRNDSVVPEPRHRLMAFYASGLPHSYILMVILILRQIRGRRSS